MKTQNTNNQLSGSQNLYSRRTFSNSKPTTRQLNGFIWKSPLVIVSSIMLILFTALIIYIWPIIKIQMYNAGWTDDPFEPIFPQQVSEQGQSVNTNPNDIQPDPLGRLDTGENSLEYPKMTGSVSADNKSCIVSSILNDTRYEFIFKESDIAQIDGCKPEYYLMNVKGYFVQIHRYLLPDIAPEIQAELDKEDPPVKKLFYESNTIKAYITYLTSRPKSQNILAYINAAGKQPFFTLSITVPRGGGDLVFSRQDLKDIGEFLSSIEIHAPEKNTTLLDSSTCEAKDIKIRVNQIKGYKYKGNCDNKSAFIYRMINNDIASNYQINIGLLKDIENFPCVNKQQCSKFYAGRYFNVYAASNNDTDQLERLYGNFRSSTGQNLFISIYPSYGDREDMSYYQKIPVEEKLFIKNALDSIEAY